MTKATYTPLSNAPYVTFEIEGTGYVYNSATDWNLVLNRFEIADAEARKYAVLVPGRDGTLDLSDALGGVYYENREIEIRFYCVNYTAERFHLLASTMRNVLDGNTTRVVFSDDLAFFWRGRPQVSAEWGGLNYSVVTVTMSAEPYKLNAISSYDAWKWDPFNFVTGVITQTDDIILNGSTETLTLPMDPARGKPTLWLNTGSARAKLSGEQTWHTLKAGANLFPEIRMSPTSEVTLMLDGTGSVGVEYRVGSL